MKVKGQKVKDQTVRFIGYQCRVDIQRYQAGGAPCIRLVSTDGMPIGTATVNVVGVKLGKTECLIKNYSENEGMLEALTEAGILTATDRTVRVGYAEATVCQLHDVDLIH
jgi:hypothetical protein